METIYSGRPAIGSQVNVEGIGLCEVMSSADPSLVTLKRPGGSTLKIGERALRDRLTSSDPVTCASPANREKAQRNAD